VSRSGPLAELRDLAARGGTGEFICAAAAVEIHVYLQHGRVAWATSSTHPFEFAKYIKEHNRIDDATFRHVVEECRRDKLPLGETLVAWDLLTWDDVNAALRHQVRLALVTLAELAGARTMFLERKHYVEYNPELTIDLASIAPAGPAPRRTAAGDLPRPSSKPPSPGLAFELAEDIEGAAWVEILDAERVVDAAPAAVSSHPRVPAELVRTTIDDDADFVAVRSARGSILGARLTRARRSLWCALAADSTFGAAVSVLSSLSAIQPHPCEPPRSTDGRVVEIGDERALDASEMRLVFGRAREILAAIVLSSRGEPVVGISRGGVDEGCVELLRRRAAVFAVPIFDRPAPSDDERTGTRMAALGFTCRTLVTGERGFWCFGAELCEPMAQTLWVLTDRNASQGLGWACLTALSRGLTRPGAADGVG
jgi:hypothetical protein